MVSAAIGCSSSSTADARDGLLERSHRDYEHARLDAVWNARKPDRYPDAILLAISQDDVIAGVKLAGDHHWRISIRSGGHSWIGNGVRDGGLLIDLSAMNTIDVDVAGRTAVVGPAARGSDLNTRLAADGLSFPAGHCPSVALGGYLLGAGYGWNSRSLGPACLSVRAADVVLADGRLIHADDTSHPDIMWAVRGSGPGFFGIVVRFYLTVYPATDRILRSVYVFPTELRDEVLSWSYNAIPTLAGELELSVKVGHTPGIDEPTTTLAAVAFCRDGAGEELLNPLDECPFLDRAVRSVVKKECTLNDLYAVSDGLSPAGRRYAVDGIWCDGPVDEILARAKDVLDGQPPGDSFLLWLLWGNYPIQDNACWSTQAPLYLSPNSVWDDPAEDYEHERWAHESLLALEDFARGTQFADANPADRPDDGLLPEHAARLEELRTVYDPRGVFRSYLTPAESTTALATHRTPTAKAAT